MGPNLEVLDRSNYFRGLLVLAREDKKISSKEIALMEEVGRRLGFEKRFCREAIDNILVNEHINPDPPKFSSKDLAEIFLRDAIRLSLLDLEIDPYELDWLKKVAAKNNLPKGWFDSELSKIVAEEDFQSSLDQLELLTLI
ncbi:MAG: TerB family tellurite resistance protein [Melioribacteraceae bacterium]|nr:TerB family tellurite resistance protein [Melioribacteraceae bacterium]MCO6472542.1 TerB family tellurite resistance protein [Melioribacteraceae bacterium]MDD3557671.1 hypothetical protein [Melioribacteraceae bacterium]